jgi:hypothetical protein
MLAAVNVADLVRERGIVVDEAGADAFAARAASGVDGGYRRRDADPGNHTEHDVAKLEERREDPRQREVEQQIVPSLVALADGARRPEVARSRQLVIEDGGFEIREGEHAFGKARRRQHLLVANRRNQTSRIAPIDPDEGNARRLHIYQLEEMRCRDAGQRIPAGQPQANRCAHRAGPQIPSRDVEV